MKKKKHEIKQLSKHYPKMITLRLTKYFNKTEFWTFIWIEQYPERITNFLRYKKSSKADRLVYNFEKKKKKAKSSACLARESRSVALHAWQMWCENPARAHKCHTCHSTQRHLRPLFGVLLFYYCFAWWQLNWNERFDLGSLIPKVAGFLFVNTTRIQQVHYFLSSIHYLLTCDIDKRYVIIIYWD